GRKRGQEREASIFWDQKVQKTEDVLVQPRYAHEAYVKGFTWASWAPLPPPSGPRKGAAFLRGRKTQHTRKVEISLEKMIQIWPFPSRKSSEAAAEKLEKMGPKIS